ncbi:uncharacterized protein LTR77_002085 [Saxophila tyrrhenica]|uniref:Sulfhydryl oxidase n=1 Tax=Saxophila tyrrhenica TaxID=1690608 RepID=A0AAV9PI34_9PEZI|nr:hypothetical protein LTR77_002085 [Saxophila tyrrhenica]
MTSRRQLITILTFSAIVAIIFVTSFRSGGPTIQTDRIPPLTPDISSLDTSDTLDQTSLIGHAIAPKLGNETAKAELGRASWKLFHTMMARFPENPTADESAALKSYIHLFQRLYPCGECAGHFGEILKRFPPQVGSRNAAAGWACHVHNQVNESLGKDVFDCSKIGDFYDCGCADDEEGEGRKAEGELVEPNVRTEMSRAEIEKMTGRNGRKVDPFKEFMGQKYQYVKNTMATSASIGLTQADDPAIPNPADWNTISADEVVGPMLRVSGWIIKECLSRDTPLKRDLLAKWDPIASRKLSKGMPMYLWRFLYYQCMLDAQVLREEITGAEQQQAQGSHKQVRPDDATGSANVPNKPDTDALDGVDLSPDAVPSQPQPFPAHLDAHDFGAHDQQPPPAPINMVATTTSIIDARNLRTPIPTISDLIALKVSRADLTASLLLTSASIVAEVHRQDDRHDLAVKWRDVANDGDTTTRVAVLRVLAMQCLVDAVGSGRWGWRRWVSLMGWRG